MRARALLIACIFFPAFLAAQPIGYLQFYGGAVEGRDQYHNVKRTINAVGPNPSTEVVHYRTTMKDGYIIGASSGMELYCGLRLEAETHFMRHEYEYLYTSDVPDPQDMGGTKLEYWSGMLNVYIDMVHPCQYLVPFLGGGVGLAQAKAEFPVLLQQIALDLPMTTDSFTSATTMKDTQYVWQLMAGVHLMKDCCRYASVMVRWWEVWPDFRYQLNPCYVVRSTAKQASIMGVYGMLF